MKSILKVFLAVVVTVPLFLITEFILGILSEPGYVQTSKGLCYAEYTRPPWSLHPVCRLWSWAVNSIR